MNKREIAFWASVGVAVGVRKLYKSGFEVQETPLPWFLKKQLINAVRRRYENADAETLLVLHKYEILNPGSISDSVLCDAELEFAETMIDNDFMNVWNKLIRRKHGFKPNHQSILEPRVGDDEDDDWDEDDD